MNPLRNLRCPTLDLSSSSPETLIDCRPFIKLHERLLSFLAVSLVAVSAKINFSATNKIAAGCAATAFATVQVALYCIRKCSGI